MGTGGVLRFDLRSACSSLRASPGFSSAVIVSLATGIAAAATMLTVVIHTLVEPYPKAGRGRVVALVQMLDAGRSPVRAGITQQQLRDLRDRSRALTHVGLVAQQTIVVAATAGMSRLNGVRMSGDLFAAVHPAAALGRGLLPADDEATPEQPLVLSWRTWVDLFHGDPAAVGTTLRVGAAQFRIVGVMPEQDRFPLMTRVFRNSRGDLDATPEFWLPFQQAGSGSSSFTFWPAMGILDAHQSTAQATADLIATEPPTTGARLQSQVVELGVELTRHVRVVLLQLLAGALFVLIVSALNVVSLTSNRMLRTRRSFAIRSALGATPGQLRRHFVMEGLVLSLAAASIGLLMAWDLLLVVRQVSPADLPHLRDVRFDVNSFLVSALTAVLAGLAATLAPALRTRFDALFLVFKPAGHVRPYSVVRHSLTVLATLEVAVAVVLMVWAALSVANLAALRSGRHGFNPAGLITFKTSLPESQSVAPEEQSAINRRLAAIIGSVRNVEAFATARAVELVLTMAVDGRALDQGVPVQPVSPGYFGTLGAHLIRGREFSDEEATGDAATAIVNQSFADQFGHGADILGRLLTINDRAPLTVIGLVSDIREGRADSPPAPEVYVPFDERRPSATTTWDVRTTGRLDPTELRRAISRAGLPVALYDFAPAAAIQREAVAPDLMYALVASAFAAVSLLFASLGLFGLVSSAISARWTEFRLRCVFGAAAATILRALAGRALAVAGTGLLLGGTAAVVVARFVPWGADRELRASPSIGIGVALLAAIIALAAYLPLRRLIRLDPSAVLKWR